MVILTV